MNRSELVDYIESCLRDWYSPSSGSVRYYERYDGAALVEDLEARFPESFVAAYAVEEE